jgi:AcrR family transcriptional regulator
MTPKTSVAATVTDSTAAILTTASGTEADRPLRADAVRNRERLIEAARAVFSEQGGSASMEAIAKAAGVGVGTLYRHFPRRIDVVEAVYRIDVDNLSAAAEAAVSGYGPWGALEAFLEAFLLYAQGKRTFLNELHEAFDKNPELRVQCRERIESAMGSVLEGAQKAGVVRTDIDGADLMQLLGPVCSSPTLSEGQGELLLSLVLDGLRTSN